ncbi:MAG: TVP38/TMEM64 family protein, partial [Verrucomicrobia bacterium]|nr:TVP38/TMEM64 family protein [Deltaproteobacteria bacterium]
MNSKKIILLIIAVLAVGLFFWFDLGSFLTLDALKANRQALLDFYAAHRLVTVAGFMAIYIIQTALSLPGAAI